MTGVMSAWRSAFAVAVFCLLRSSLSALNVEPERVQDAAIVPVHHLRARQSRVRGLRVGAAQGIVHGDVATQVQDGVSDALQVKWPA
jgi:hypothetical protein